MTKDELLTYLRGACDRMLETVERKNHDYTAAAEDALANFKAVELLGICSAETGIMVRRCDKFMREITAVKKGEAGLQVKDESVEDTLYDDAAYALLAAAVLHEKKLKAIKRHPAVKTHKVQVGIRQGAVVLQGSNWVLDLGHKHTPVLKGVDEKSDLPAVKAALAGLYPGTSIDVEGLPET